MLNFFKIGQNRRIAAGFCLLLLLLAVICPGVNPAVPVAINSNEVSFSSSNNLFDLLFYPLQAKVEYSLYQAESVSEYTFPKRIPANETPNIFQNYERQNNLSGLFCPARVSANILPKDIKFLYLFSDIPPPFSAL